MCDLISCSEKNEKNVKVQVAKNQAPKEKSSSRNGDLEKFGDESSLKACRRISMSGRKSPSSPDDHCSDNHQERTVHVLKASSAPVISLLKISKPSFCNRMHQRKSSNLLLALGIPSQTNLTFLWLWTGKFLAQEESQVWKLLSELAGWWDADSTAAHTQQN